MMSNRFELHTWGGPEAPMDTRDDVAWAKWTEEHRAWRRKMDSLLSAAIFALDEQLSWCVNPEGDCEVCDESGEARKLLFDTLSPEGKDVVNTVRRLLPIVEAVVE